MPYSGIGVTYNRDAINNSNPFYNLQVSILLAHNRHNLKLETIDANDYLCMYKYGLHSDVEALNKLIAYAQSHHYEIISDVLDLCIVDNYYSSNRKDLCCLQVAIKKIDQ